MCNYQSLKSLYTVYIYRLERIKKANKKDVDDNIYGHTDDVRVGESAATRHLGHQHQHASSEDEIPRVHQMLSRA